MKKRYKKSWIDEDFHKTIKVRASEEGISMLEYQRCLNKALKKDLIHVNVKKNKRGFSAYINF